MSHCFIAKEHKKPLIVNKFLITYVKISSGAIPANCNVVVRHILPIWIHCAVCETHSTPTGALAFHFEVQHSSVVVGPLQLKLHIGRHGTRVLHHVVHMGADVIHNKTEDGKNNENSNWQVDSHDDPLCHSLEKVKSWLKIRILLWVFKPAVPWVPWRDAIKKNSSDRSFYHLHFEISPNKVIICQYCCLHNKGKLIFAFEFILGPLLLFEFQVYDIQVTSRTHSILKLVSFSQQTEPIFSV